MADVELALAASARAWSDALHRFLADHGGARVRTVVMSAQEVVDERYDVLIIDDVCSFLTPRLVEEVRRPGRLVVGVFDSRDGADAKRRLLDCGVDDVIESDASPDEFLAVVGRLSQLAPSAPDWMTPTPVHPVQGRVVAVGAPPGGCGATEVALGLAAVLDAVVVDADDVAPSVAQRVGASLHPNLRTAIDMVHHRDGDLAETIVDGGGVRLLPGLATGDDWSQLHPGEVEAVIDELAAFEPLVVVNVGAGLERPQVGEGRFGLARGVLRRSDTIVGVTLPQPVAITRSIRWALEAKALAVETPLAMVVNRSPRSRFRRTEIEGALARALPDTPVFHLPEDDRVAEAAWSGIPVPGGPFLRALRQLAREVVA